MTVASDFLADVFGPSTVERVYLSSLPNDDARDRQPGEKRLATRAPDLVERFVADQDRADRGLYFCTATITAAAKTRSKQTLAELNGLHVDIDFRSVRAPPDEVERILRQVRYLPSKVVHSGNGLHAYWLFQEALPAPENIERIEALLRLLADHLGGDLKCAEVSRLMRLPGTHNTKGGAWTEVRLIEDRPLRYELDDLAEWLETASPVIHRRPAGGNGLDDPANPWLAVASLFVGTKPPIDIEQRLAAMRYQGDSETAIHATQISVSAALLNRGHPIDEAVDIVLAATRAAAGPFGERWNWRREERDVRGMCETWLEKHPQIKTAEKNASPANDIDEFPLYWHGEVDPSESRAWLIGDLLPEAGKGLVSGQSGLFKTFVMLDLAAAVMAGAVFIDLPVLRRGGVLFIAAEGASEIPVRLAAVFKTKYPGIERMPFAWTKLCPRLLDQKATMTLTAIARRAADRIKKEFGLPLALIVIDTVVAGAGFARAGDENDAATGQIIMNVLERLSQQTGALVLGVDHFGKSSETGTRGTSAKEASADVVLAILGNKSISGTVTETRLAARKRRGGASGEEFMFLGREVAVGGVDRYGKEIKSVVIDWSARSEPKTRDDGQRWSKSIRLLRQVLMNILVDQGTNQRPFPDGPLVRAVDIETVRREFYRSCLAEGDTEAKKAASRRKAFGRAVSSAQAGGLIALREIGRTTFVWLSTEAPDA
jgi:AAA domain/RepB DNA-primase from phage plasmid